MSLRQALQDLARRARELHPVDPARFNDAVASRTEWTPLRIGGASFRTHHLVEKNPGRLEFRAGPPRRLLLFGAGMVVFALVFWGIASAVPVAITALVAIGGLVFLRPAVFDRGSGQYWIGWLQPGSGAESATAGRLHEVYALQLLGERIPRKRGRGFPSYELNLVLRSGERRNVVDHGGLAALREEARQLARFLGCRLWDATDAEAVAPAAGGMGMPRVSPDPAAVPSPVARTGFHPLRVLFGALGQVIGTLFVLSLLVACALIYLMSEQPETFQALVQWVFEQVAAADAGA